MVRAPDGAVRTVPAVRKKGTTVRDAGIRQYRYVAKVTGLRPATTYRHRIATGSGSTRWRRFRTAVPEDAAFTLLQFGDTQIANAGVPQRIVDAAAARFRDARLMLLAGEVVDRPWRGAEWRALHRALAPPGTFRSVVAAIGNHEQCRLTSACRSGNGAGFRSYFHGPTNGFPRQHRTWFHTDVGAARIIVLDSFGSDLPRQRRFLRKALRTNDRPWSIVLVHSGPFASWPDRVSSTMRSTFLRTLERHGADLVLSGHDHSYARGMKAGVTYLTSVSGPKYYASSARDWRRGGATRGAWASRTSTYQAITVTPDRITVRAIVGHRADGARPAARVGDVLDRFSLRR